VLSVRPIHVDASTARAALARDRLIRLAVALVLACAAPESRAGILAALAEGLGAGGPAVVAGGYAQPAFARAAASPSGADRLSEREIALGGALALFDGAEITLDRPALSRAGAAPSTDVVPLASRPRGPARNRDP